MTCSLTRSLAAILGTGGLLAAAAPVAADPIADFYKDRTVTIVFGAGMGGSYGLYSQLATRHLGANLPGTPNIIIQSMPGAGGMKAANYIFNAAPKDGSLIGLVHQEVLQETILNPKAKFEADKYNWIGRFVDIAYIGLVPAKRGIKSLEDAKKSVVPAGATGMRAASGLAPEVFNRIAGTKFKVVAGYRGVNDMFLAQEKGEIDLVTASWVISSVLKGDQIKSGEMVPIYAMSLERIPELPKTPAITEFGRNEAETLFLRLWAAGGMVGRSLATPPGVPADRTAAFRAAFAKMVASADFKKDTKDKHIALNTMPGAELQTRIAKVLDVTPEQVTATRKVYGDLLPAAREQKKGKGKSK